MTASQQRKKEMMMFKRIIGALLTGIILAVVVIGTANAGVTNLEGVTVTASTSDFVQVTVPVDLMWIARYERNYMSISDVDYVTDMTRLQVCHVLKQAPPADCNMSNYPAAPGIPGAGGS
ncbi:MAG: hypothetical protein ABI268_00335, partial [Rhodanobacter sp.]